MIVNGGRFFFSDQALDKGTEETRREEGVVEQFEFIVAAELQDFPEISIDVCR